jgi:hypothetical protein
MLHLVVHHPKTRNQKWANEWKLEEGVHKLKSISTTQRVFERCRIGQKVRIHRLALSCSVPATICGEAEVADLKHFGGRLFVVSFQNFKALDEAPTSPVTQGLNCYDQTVVHTGIKE